MWAHYSWGVHRGGAFTPVKCTLCGYAAATERKWRADVAAWEKLPDAEQKAACKAHNGCSEDVACGECAPEGPEDDDDADFLRACVAAVAHKHHHQLLFIPPACHFGMERAGVDQLHLVYLNHFKHLFNHTVHANLPSRKKKLVAAYLKQCGFYSYAAPPPLPPHFYHTRTMVRPLLGRDPGEEQVANK